MFSERLIDDVEKIQERPACKYFRRAAKPRRGEQVASFERRSQHGAPKDKKWHDKNYLYKIREDFARIQNDVLARNGFSIHVNHRSLAAQKEEAEKNGDEFLAKLYKRAPEAHIGVIAAHKESTPATEVKKYREAIHHKQHSLFLVDFNQKATAEGETLFSVNQAESASRALMNSQAYRSTNLHDASLRLLNQEIVAELTRIRELKRNLVIQIMNEPYDISNASSRINIPICILTLRNKILTIGLYTKSCKTHTSAKILNLSFTDFCRTTLKFWRS